MKPTYRYDHSELGGIFSMSKTIDNNFSDLRFKTSVARANTKHLSTMEAYAQRSIHRLVHVIIIAVVSHVCTVQLIVWYVKRRPWHPNKVETCKNAEFMQSPLQPSCLNP